VQENRASLDRPKKVATRTLRALTIVGGVAAFLFVAGFVLFIRQVSEYEIPRNVFADGVVALTGGASRIPDALELLDHGHARRLLITGVHPSTTAQEIARQQKADSARLFECCVDLDRRALNTAGNAEEIRHWVERRGYRSIIVVTSEYHMPRSLTELARVMPEIELVPYPVSSPVMRESDSWIDGELARLLLSEYVKYVVSLARQRLEQPAARVSVAQAARSPGLGN